MNLILFKESFKLKHLDLRDPVTQHIIKVLKLDQGDIFFIGFVNGERAVAEIFEIKSDGSILIKVIKTESIASLFPVDLLIGLPRPQTAKKVLYEASCFGVRSLHFFQSDQTEPSYTQSKLWKNEVYMNYLYKGAEQAFHTHIPKVYFYEDLITAESNFTKNSYRIILDNYDGICSLGQFTSKLKLDKPNLIQNDCVLGFGAERGWSARERELLKKNNWNLVHLGPRVFRLESAVISSLSLVADALEFYDKGTDSSLLDLYN